MAQQAHQKEILMVKKLNKILRNDFNFIFNTDTDQNKKISTSDEDNDNKSDENVGIKQEHFHDEDFDSALSGQPPFKKIRSDCELVTNNINGMYNTQYYFLLKRNCIRTSKFSRCIFVTIDC